MLNCKGNMIKEATEKLLFIKGNKKYNVPGIVDTWIFKKILISTINP